MTVRESIWIVGAFGLLTAVVLGVGAGTVGGLLALMQLCVLVGAPMAVALRDELRSWAVVAVVAITLSIALSALTAQSLIWFELAVPEVIVLAATAYGIVLAVLLSSTDVARPAAPDDGEAAR